MVICHVCSPSPSLVCVGKGLGAAWCLFSWVNRVVCVRGMCSMLTLGFSVSVFSQVRPELFLY